MRAHRISLWLGALAAGWLSAAAYGATFGTPVSIGGQAADLALDEARGVLYIANFTANRIDVMSLADNAIRRSFNVSPQPGGVAISPDGQFLVVTHYGSWAAPNTSKNALTVINLNDNTRQTFALGYPPLGVAFGADGLALVVTASDLVLFDPLSGVVQGLAGISDLAATTLPTTAATFPPQIISASVAASGDGMWIYGLCDWGGGAVLRYRYDVRRRQVSTFGFTSSPAMGPRTIAPSLDGSFYVTGWGLFTAAGDLISQYTNVTGALNVGSHAVDSWAGIIYSQVPTNDSAAPILSVVDADNLAVRERLYLPENLAGKAVLNSAANTMYAVSDSGVMVLPVGSLARQHRVAAAQEDLVFRGAFCNRPVLTQDLTIVDPGGGHTDFTLSASSPGVSLSATGGVTPATVRVQIDSSVFQAQNGTSTATIQIASGSAVNVPRPVRLLINNRNPDQRGTFVDVPGTLVDLVADPYRDRFYVLRQDRNQVLVFDGNATQVATLRTKNTPTQMAMTFDGQFLMIGHNDSQMASVYNLDTYEQQPPIIFPFGHYPKSLAASAKAVLALARKADGTGVIENVDLWTNTATTMSNLGIYENKVNAGGVLTAAPNGGSILLASPDGNVMLYNASADTFVASRKDVTSLGGAYAASSYDQYVVDNLVLNSSLVAVHKLETGTGNSSGFVFVGPAGFRSTAPGIAAPGVIQRVDALTGSGIRPTRMVEAPLLPVNTATLAQPFTRTLGTFYNQSAVVALTVSGITVLPWTYDAAVAPPQIQSVVNAADLTAPVAPGGLISVQGTQLSPVNIATKEVPLPTALGESCLTVNGMAVPMLFASSTQVNAQLPFNVDGSAVLVLRTPGGVSDNYNLTISATAPSIFRNGTAGPETGIATVVRLANNQLVTPTNPIHPGDQIVIYATGLGRTDPALSAGVPAPSDPLAKAIVTPTVQLGGTNLTVSYAGLAPGEIGVYQINAGVPKTVAEGMQVSLTVSQGGGSTTIPVRVVK